MHFFRIFHFHSRFCSVTTPCGLRSPALVSVTEETFDMNLERKVARKLRLLSSPVFGALGLDASLVCALQEWVWKIQATG